MSPCGASGTRSSSGVIQSMGRVGSALDNAAAEAFNSILKVEYVHRHRFRTRAEARLKIATWIVDFYNTRRRHSACDGMSPIDYERLMAEARRPEAAQPNPPRFLGIDRRFRPRTCLTIDLRFLSRQRGSVGSVGGGA